MDDVLVRLIGATKTYGEGGFIVTAVEAATCQIGPGDRVAIVGPSGSGKSTLLFLLAGLEWPTTGTVAWPALGPGERLRPGPVAVAFQGASLLPPLTVRENVALPLLLAGVGEVKANDAARGVLERFEVSDIADKLPEEISAGQSQRVGLARSVVGQPSLILVDEPTGQQDRSSAHLVVGELLASAEGSGAALVIATHDPVVADATSRRWFMHSGHLETEVP